MIEAERIVSINIVYFRFLAKKELGFTIVFLLSYPSIPYSLFIHCAYFNNIFLLASILLFLVLFKLYIPIPRSQSSL